MVQLGQRFMLIFPVPLQGHALHQFHTDAYCWIFYCRFGFGVCIVIEQTSEVVIAVSAEAASFFKRRRLIANQVIEKELEDGSLILSPR